MPWPWVSILESAVFAALAFGLRSLVQYRRTGTSGFRLASSRGVERLTTLAVSIAMVLWQVVPVATLLGWLPPLPSLDRDAVHAAGLVIGVLGMAATLWAQFSMGASWRVGVDSQERTALVTGGPFGWVRNPIYSAMLIFAVGGALLVPNLLAPISLLALIVSLDLQVRYSEEPYLMKLHGPAYLDWASRVGRFIPGIGRLSNQRLSEGG
jgi:protein-S-isoprenylcysteine O-methyltransferase Ste14